MTRNSLPIDLALNNSLSRQVEFNRKVLKSVFKSVIFCGYQNIPLRGHRDDQTSTSLNKGNFLALLEFRSEAGDSVLCDHFQNA